MKQITYLLLCLLCSCPSLFAQEQNDYLKWMQLSLPDVPEWTAWQKKTGELPPDFNKLKKSNLLPDPLHFYNGSVVKNTPGDWTKRRNEIKQLFEKYVTGTFPPKASINKVVQLDETNGEGYLVRNVRVEFGPEGKASVRVRLVIPDGIQGEKFPVMISPNLAGWASTVIRRGYISAGYAGNDAMDDAAQLKDLYPDHDFATLPRRAWLASIVIDYLATVPQVNMKQIAINGYLRDGKMATMAAAFDERIAAVVAGSTGVGGLVPWRFGGERGGGEGIETTTRSFPSWFIPYTIQFDLPSALTGKAFLRFAICGTGTRTFDVEVNGKPAGKLENLTGDGVITRHGYQGLWYERSVDFDASLMQKGSNAIKIIVPQRPVNNGIVYDYIRLELGS